MAQARLFVQAPLTEGASFTLDRERSHYLCRVLRLRADATLELFSGDGTAWAAHVSAPDPRRCRVTVIGQAVREREPRCRMHLGQALLKTDRLDYVLQKATELGVTDIWLLETERGEARVRTERRASRLGHWQRILRSACEQSGRLRVPMLHPPGPLDGFWAASGGVRRYAFQPGAPPFDPGAVVADTALVIGPEGGFSEAEIAAAHAAGAIAAGLGELTLRADTAPVAALSLLRQAWSWQAP